MEKLALCLVTGRETSPSIPTSGRRVLPGRYRLLQGRLPAATMSGEHWPPARYASKATQISWACMHAHPLCTLQVWIKVQLHCLHAGL